MAKANRKRIFLSPPHQTGTEMAFIREAIESNYIAPLGPQVDAFEKEFCELTGIGNAAAVTSGTAAMHLAMRALNVGPGEEVLASDMTFLGSVTPAVFQGATPVFIDSDPETWNMDVDLLAEEMAACDKRGKLPKAVIPTDLYGQCADMDRISDICRPYGVPVIADAAESLGAEYKGRSAGKGAAASIYSFNGNKIVTTSGGGMLASDDPYLIKRARFLSQQARDPFPHYEHSEIGYNYRMSNILAALGRSQLQALASRVEKKREIFDYYRNALSELPGLEFMPEAAYGRSSRWLTVILITSERFGAKPEDVRTALEAENIESRPVWKPMHMQPAFNGENAAGGVRARVAGGSVGADLFARGLCLPSGTQMTEEELDLVVSVIRGCRRLHK